MKKHLIALLAIVATLFTAHLLAQSTMGAIATPQINSTFYVGSVPGFNSTIQVTVTAACAASGNRQVSIPAGYAGSDLISGVTGGCTSAYIKDERSVPNACFTWSGSTYAAASCASASSGGSLTSFAAPSASWPSWLVPTVTNATSTPSLAVTASAIPIGALPATGGGSAIPTGPSSGVTASEVATYSGTQGGLGTTGIFMPPSIIPSAGTSFLQIGSTGIVQSISGITAACAGPTCGTQQINFAPCSTLTTLAAAITISQTTGITVTSAACLPATGVIGVNAGGNTEEISYTSLSGAVLVGVTRGFWGSTAETAAPGATVVLAQLVYSTGATATPSFIYWQSGALWYDPAAGGVCSSCLTTKGAFYGSSANYFNGMTVDTGNVMLSNSTTSLFSGSVTIANGTGACGTRGWQSGGISTDDTFFTGVTGGACSVGTNGLPPNTFGIRAWVPGPTPTSGPWQWSVDLAGDMAITGHLNQNAAGNYAGSCTMSSATTCTFALTAGYVGSPLGFVSPTTAYSGGYAACTVSGTTVTITAPTSNSDTWNCLLVGNPN